MDQEQQNSYYKTHGKSLKQLRENSRQKRRNINNLPKNKENINDVKRYKEHLANLYRAKEILNSEEPPSIKELLLCEIGCDKDTYGEWVIRRDGHEHLKTIKSKMSHIWALDREIRSFEYAIKFLDDEI